jgi:hypothetical protein
MQKCIRVLFFLSPLLLLIAFGSHGLAQSGYTPQAKFCVDGKSSLCSIVPGDIGDDPALDIGLGYRGLIGKLPTSAKTDVQTPFDNLSWQSFVALNWTAGKQGKGPEQGLQSDGARVWQTWARPGDIFQGQSIQADCSPIGDDSVFSFASDGNGNEVALHEEIIQASTGDPLIDIDGNWTIYERRLNGGEIGYLQAPGGHKEWNLTNAAGQKAFLAASQKVNFPAGRQTPDGFIPGAMEIKAAWRILDLKKHPEDAKRFYVIHALLAVAPDLVARPGRPAAPICAHVDLGLVAMHIIQKNNARHNLNPVWFWSTFEHVDNAPLAATPCDVTAPEQCKLGPLTQPELQSCPPRPAAGPAPEYSYFNKSVPSGGPVNQPPQALLGSGGKFFWSPEQPFAASYLKSVAGKRIGTQVARCWKIFEMTDALNAQWRAALRNVNSVFQNYMLVSTQWGTGYETPLKVPADAAPNMLSNTLLETYMQKAYDPKEGFNTGSCISCHNVATFDKSKVKTDLSFLPSLIQREPIRRAPLFQAAQ